MNYQALNNDIKGIINESCNLRCANNYPLLLEDLVAIQNELDAKEFRITVVGEFSSGKSTFLNALIGKDILPHGVKETTATVTYIHNVNVSDDRLNTAVVHFQDESVKDVTLDIGSDSKALVDYVTTSKQKYDVVKDIMSVDVYVHFADIEEPMVLIDTPGMNGVAEGHRDITLHEIRHSHASICLFHLRGIGKTDLDFIKELKKFQNTFFFVLNAIDDIKSNEETYEERLASFTRDLKENVFSAETQLNYIFGISSLKALVARDESIPRLYDYDKRDLTAEDRQRILNESKMEEFEHALMDFLSNSEKEKKFYDSICSRLCTILSSIKEGADRHKSIREAKISNIPEKKKIEELISKANVTFEKFRGNIQYTLKASISDLRDELYPIIREDIQKEYEAQVAYIAGLDFDGAKKTSDNNTIGKNLNTFWNTQKETLVEKMKSGLKEIQTAIVADMQRVIPSISFKDKQISIESKESFVEFDGSATMSRLQNLRKQKDELEQQISQSNNQESSDSLRRKLSEIEREEYNLQSKCRSELRNLGTRPDPEYVVRSYTTQAPRSLKNIFGLLSRTETHHYTVKDDSAQREWDDEKRAIENRYKESIDAKKREKSVMENKVEAAENNEQMRSIWQNRVKDLESKIAQEQMEMERLMRDNKTSFLKKLKNDFQRAIERQLGPNGQMYADLTEGVRNNLEQSEGPMLKALYDIFDNKKNEYIKSLNLIIDRINASANVADNENQIRLLASDIKQIDNCLTQLKALQDEL